MKAKPPKEILARRAKKPHSQKEPQLKKGSFWKILEWSLGIGIGVAGLTLTALQFQARPTVSLDAPLDPKDVLTTQIVISNDGLTDLQALDVQTFFKTIELPRHSVVSDNIGSRPILGHMLAVGEKETVQPEQIFDFGPGMSNKTIKLDFAMMFKFRPAYWPFSKRRFFRFEMARNADGTQRLHQIPAGDIDKDYDATVKRMRDNLRNSRVPFPL